MSDGALPSSSLAIDDVAGTRVADSESAARRASGRLRLGSGWSQLAAISVIVVMSAYYLGVTKATGAIPQNDDWSFIRSALRLHRTGDLRLQGWGQMFLVGQLVSAQPLLVVFGDRVASLRLYGVLMTAVWLWCAFLVARRVVDPRRAVLLVGVLALWPGMGLLASSFMTDMPAVAMALLTIVVGVRAVERQSRHWLLLALLVGVFGFTIREQAVVAIGAVLVGALVSHASTRRFRLETTVAVIATGVLCVVLEYARHQLANPDLAPFGLRSMDLSSVPAGLMRVPFTLGLDLSPLAAWALLSLRGRRAWLDPGRLAGWALGAAGLVALSDGFSQSPRVLLTNYLQASGGFSVALVGSPQRVFDPMIWEATKLVGAVAGVILLGEVGACIGKARRQWPAVRAGDPVVSMLAAYTAFLAFLTVLLSFAGQHQVDRYQVGLLPALGLLLLAVPPRGRDRPEMASAERAEGRLSRVLTGTLAAGLTCLLAYLSVANTLATDRRNQAVWHAATQLTRGGVPATSINAGLAWNGFHATSPVDRTNPSRDDYRGQHWIYLFPESTDCYLVATSPVVRTWMRFISFHEGGSGVEAPSIYVYRDTHCH